MIKKLLTIKEYCKINKITDSAVRKQITTGKAIAVSIEDQTYIVTESNEIDLLKASHRSAREKIKTLQAEANLYINQSEQIKKLESKIEALENKIDEQRNSKEELYEKVIGQYDRLLPR
jgi:predicted RNase H-like nuclease (RuvC/YqgF family)